MRSSIPVIEKQTATWIKLCHEAARKGETLEMDSLATRFTFDVISEVAMGKNFDSLCNPDECVLYRSFNRVLAHMYDLIKMKATRKLVFFARKLGYKTQLDVSSAQLKKLVMAIVRSGRESMNTSNQPPEGSIFSLLLKATDDKGNLLPDECVCDNLVSVALMVPQNACP